MSRRMIGKSAGGGALLLALAGLLSCAAGQQPAHASQAAPPSESKAPALVIANVSVLPMDRERVLPGQTVVIRDGRISQMGPAAEVTSPAGARVINGAGKFLIPGLVDLHVHLASNPGPEQRDLLALFVVNGVTTVLNLRGDPRILELRAKTQAGEFLAPRIYTAGPYVNEPFFTTPDSVEQAVVEQKRAGYDFVKIHGDLSRDAYARLNAVGRREGIRVIGHAPRNLGVEAMFEERQYAVVHAEEFLYDRQNSSRDFALLEPKIPDLGRSMAANGIWLMPNLTAYRIIGLQARDLSEVLARPEMRYLPVSVQNGWGPATNPYTARFGPDAYPRFIARLELLQKLVLGFERARVGLLLGTDAMNTGVVPGTSAHDELGELVTAGLTPFEALRAATSNAAAFLAEGDRRGIVAAGENADLVLLDANPLVDIAHTRRIAGVAIRGKWLSRSDLDLELERLRTP